MELFISICPKFDLLWAFFDTKSIYFGHNKHILAYMPIPTKQPIEANSPFHKRTNFCWTAHSGEIVHAANSHFRRNSPFRRNNPLRRTVHSGKLAHSGKQSTPQWTLQREHSPRGHTSWHTTPCEHPRTPEQAYAGLTKCKHFGGFSESYLWSAKGKRIMQECTE